MRKSIALTCLLSTLIVCEATAQCPKVHRNRQRSVSVNPCYQSLQLSGTPQISACQTSNRCASQPILQSYPVMQGCPVVQSHQAVHSFRVSQNYQVAPSMNYPSTELWTVIPQSPFQQAPAFPQNAHQITQSNCNCIGDGTHPHFSTQSLPQTATTLEHRHNPFSLAGHAHEARPPDLCLKEFLACCDSGGKDCMLNYYKCAEITGEPVKHTECPAASRSKAKPQ